MAELKLNETPVRTSRNFGINNIKIKDIEFSKKEEFKNIQIIGIENIAKANKDTSDFELKYGIGRELEEEVKQHANHRLKIEIDKNSNIQIINNFDNQNKRLIENIEIISNQNTKSDIILKYKAQDNIKGHHNGIVRLHAKEGSKLNVIILNFLNVDISNFISIQTDIEENAEINYKIIDFGGKESITNCYTNLKRKSC